MVPLNTVRIAVLVDDVFKLHAVPNSFRGDCFKQDHWDKSVDERIWYVKHT